MSNSATPPIVTDDDGDIMFFASITDACRYLEAIDVQESVYEAFDAQGNPLILTTEGDQVRISPTPGQKSQPEELASRLRSYIKSVGSDRIGLPNPDDASLDELVTALERFFDV